MSKVGGSGVTCGVAVTASGTTTSLAFGLAVALALAASDPTSVDSVSMGSASEEDVASSVPFVVAVLAGAAFGCGRLLELAPLPAVVLGSEVVQARRTYPRHHPLALV